MLKHVAVPVLPQVLMEDHHLQEVLKGGGHGLAEGQEGQPEPTESIDTSECVIQAPARTLFGQGGGEAF